MYSFNRKTTFTIRFKSREPFSLEGYTSKKEAFPFAVGKLSTGWVVVNRYSGQVISRSFNTKKYAEQWFNEFVKLINIKDIDLFNPHWRHKDGFATAGDEAEKRIFYKNYRRLSFGE